MQISIDEGLPEPVFLQLSSQIREAVKSGELQPDTPLPTIRQLASELQVNPNTVAKAYRLLERDGVIETRGGQGSFIHREGRKHSRIDISTQAAPVLAQTVASLRALGLTDSEIRNAFARVMKVQI
jgi:GntR family transcriptional regulator